MPLFGPPNVAKLKERRDVQGLVKATGHKDEALRLDAAMALRDLGDPRAIGAFISLFSAADEQVRIRALDAVGESGDRDSTEALMSVLHYDPDPGIRSQAALALGKIREPRAIRVFLEDVQRWQGPMESGRRAHVLPALKLFPDAVDHILLALQESEWNEETRAWLVAALRDVASARSDLFINVLRTESSALARFQAALALIDLYNTRDDPSVTAALVNALGDSFDYVSGRSMTALREKKDPSAFEPLVKALEATNPAVRSRAATVLGDLGDSRAIDALVRVLEDGDPDVRLRVTEALEVLGWQPPEPKVDLDRIRRYVRDGEWQRLPAFGEAAVDPIVEALEQTSNNWTVMQAADALAEIGSSRALPALRRAIERLKPFKVSDSRQTEVIADEFRRVQHHLREAISRLQGMAGS